MTEKETIEAAQDALVAAKAAMRKFQVHMGDLMRINTDAGRLPAANAAMRVRDTAMQIRGSIGVMHADATDAMATHFPEFSSEIQTRGPGGGR